MTEKATAFRIFFKTGDPVVTAWIHAGPSLEKARYCGLVQLSTEGWGAFRAMLEDGAVYHGKVVEFVDETKLRRKS